MENNLATDKVLSRFFKDHPEAASTILIKSEPEQIAKLISNSSNDSFITALSFLPVSLLEESLAGLTNSNITKIIGQLPITLTRSIFHQWTLKKRMDAKRVEDILLMLEPKFAASVKMLLQYPIHTIGSIMNSTPFSVRENLTAGEVLSILKKEKNRYSRYIYIIDENSSLHGVIPFKDIFYANKASLISTLMSKDIFFLHPENSIKKTYNDPCWKKWDSIPVVDEENFLVGLLRFEAIEAKMSEEGKKSATSNSEISQAGNAISEVFQIGINATVSALMLPLEGDKKP